MFPRQNFSAQEPDEKIIASLHRHWFVFIGKFGLCVLLMAVPVGIWFVWDLQSSTPLDSSSFGYGLAIMAAGLYYLFIWMLAFGFWLDYYLDYFLITDRRVVDIEQSGLFARSVAELRLYRIQDVTSEVKGLWPTLLRFGNVYIQTAGEKERFVFQQVPHPDLVVKQLLKLTDKIDDQVERPKLKTALPTRPVQQR